MDTQTPVIDCRLEVTPMLQRCLIAISNSRQPPISAEQAQELINLRLAARWANLLVLTHAGRQALYARL